MYNEDGAPAPNSDAKEVAHKGRQTLKLVLEHFNKHRHFSSGMDDDWTRPIHQFNLLAHDYTS